MSKTTAILGAVCALLLAALSFAGGWFTRKLLRPDKTRTEIITDTVWRWERDTVILASSEPVGSVIVRVPVVVRDTVYKAENDTIPSSFDNMVSQSDSATVEIPIEQRTYEGEYYKAVVQGFRPELVSIDIRHPEVPIEAPKHKWWTVTVGPQLGYGLTPAGWQPYAGLGVTFGISF